MIYKRVDFDDGRPYVGHRPRGSLVLHGPGGSHGKTWTNSALVDTGADFMHLPKSAALSIGISFAAARSIKSSTAGGIVTFERLTVDVEIEGVTVKVPVNFGVNVPALIGRQAMFAVLDTAGFTTSEWLLKWLPSAPSSI